MTEYTKKEAEKEANTSTGAVAGGLLGLAALLIGSAVSNSNEKKKLKIREAELEDKIREINTTISEYENQFLGSWLNSDTINELKKERAKYQDELKEVKKKLA